jgi:hypothetical protein
MRTRTVGLGVALCALYGCASTSVPEPAFLEVYTAAIDGADMKLEMLRQMPRQPEAGWLNSVDQAAADGRFRATSRKPVKFELVPNFVAFQAHQDGQFPSAKYYWRNGSLVVCMLRFTPGSVTGSNSLALGADYGQCATMVKSGP